jgi:DNA invertase Pin-like site-specific DNA recombinase
MAVKHHQEEAMLRTIGYCLVDDAPVELESARAALVRLGAPADRIYVDIEPNTPAQDRLGLNAALTACRPRDVLAVPSLDRLARSMSELDELTETIVDAEVLLNVGGVVFDPVNDEEKPIYASLLAYGD